MKGECKTKVMEVIMRTQILVFLLDNAGKEWGLKLGAHRVSQLSELRDGG